MEINIDVDIDTESRYHIRRYVAMVAVADTNPPRCHYCGDQRYQELEFHHPDGGRSKRSGGYQALREIEQDIVERNDVLVVCETCHKEHDEERRKYP